MSLASNLDIPLIYQEDDFSCVPICIKMILEFVRTQNVGSYIPNLEIEEISKAIGTNEDGTTLEDVEKINKKLEKCVPSIEFVTKENCDFKEIEEEVISKGNPIIAWIAITHRHSIVITGLDMNALTVYYNDPEIGKKQIETGKFISAWNSAENVLIKVKIGEKIQRVIPEYVEKIEERDGGGS